MLASTGTKSPKLPSSRHSSYPRMVQPPSSAGYLQIKDTIFLDVDLILREVKNFGVMQAERKTPLDLRDGPLKLRTSIVYS